MTEKGVIQTNYRLAISIGLLVLTSYGSAFAQNIPPNNADTAPASESREFFELTDWTHSWDLKDAITYVPDATEQSTFGISSAPRVLSVPDKGSIPMPLNRDTGPWGAVYGAPALPGPLYIASDAYFAGRASFFSDRVLTGGEGLFSALVPNADPLGSSTYFNAPNGYMPPYWLAGLAHPQPGEVPGGTHPARALVIDSFLGSSGAGPTLGGTITGENWGVACFGPLPEAEGGPGFFWEGIDKALIPQTVLVILYVGSGIDGSWLEVNWRENGRIQTLREPVTLGSRPDAAPFPYKEAFFGYVETMRDSAIGIKVGAEPTTAETDNLRNWAARYITEAENTTGAPSHN